MFNTCQYIFFISLLVTGSICEVNPNICPSNANCVDDANEEAGYRCDCVAGLVLTANGGCEGLFNVH